LQSAERRAQSEKTKFKKQNSKIYHRGTENTEDKLQKTKFKIQIAVRRGQSEKTNLKKQNSKIYHRGTENTENKSQKTKFK
jgi:ribosomal protein L31E